MAIVLQFDIFRFSSFPKIHNRLYKNRLCIKPQYLFSTPPADSVLPLWEALRLRCAAPYHRDFTSAGFSASPIGKYHYPSDCHRQTRWQSEIQVGGSRLLPQWRGYGVPTFGLIIRNKVLSACIFSCQNAAKGGTPIRSGFFSLHMLPLGDTGWGL